MDFGTVLQDQRRVRTFRRADKHSDLRFFPSGKPSVSEQRGNAFEMIKFSRLREVVDREHRMGLAAAESGLEPDDRIAALPGQPLETARENTPQPFSEKGNAKEILRRAVILSRMAGIDREEIGGELRLFEAIGE